MRELTSVIIPARNAEATLAETLESLLAQTEDGWEAVVVDDGSTDGTAAIVDYYACRDHRVRRIDGHGEGASSARNLGLEHAAGERLLFLDSDDWIAPDFLAKMTQALDRDPGAVGAFCAYRRATPSGELAAFRWSGEIAFAPFEVFARRCGVLIQAVLVKRSVVMDVGGFDTQLRTCEDWDLWQRIARTSGGFVGIEEALAFYRMSDHSLTHDLTRMVADARTVIGRGFAPDPRVRKPAPLHAGGASCGAWGGADLALAYFAMWCAAVEVGRGGDGVALMRDFGALLDMKDQVDQAAAIIVDAVMVAQARTRPLLAGVPPKLDGATYALRRGFFETRAGGTALICNRA